MRAGLLDDSSESTDWTRDSISCIDPRFPFATFCLSVHAAGSRAVSMVVPGTPSSNTRCNALVYTSEAPATVRRLKMEPVLSRNGGTGWKIDERSQHHGSTHEEKLFDVRRCRPLDDRSDRHSHSARAQGSRAWRQFLHSALILIITNGIQLFSTGNPQLGQHCRFP